jgi:putative oxidoreductase
MDIGLLILRAVVGFALAAHGSQKLFGLFGGHGIRGTGQFFESIGFRPGPVMATFAGLCELGGGLFLAFGLLVPFAAAAIITVMIAATFTVHLEKGFFSQNGGFELPLINAVAAAGLAFTGPGRYSLDEQSAWWIAGERWGALAIGLGVVGGLFALGMRATTRSRAEAHRPS